MTKLKLFLTVLALVVTGSIASTLTAAPAQAATGKVTARAGASVIDLGKAVHITGTVSPRAAGQTVTLQARVSGKWRDVRSVRINKKSGYDVAVRPRGPGAKRYRVVWGYVSSRTVPLTVYAWHYLSDLDTAHREYSCYFSEQPVGINGHTYVHSITWNVCADSELEYAEWNLGRRCTTFRGTLGLTDDSESAAKAYVEIAVDGFPPSYTNTFAYGSSTNSDLRISGALRLRISAQNLPPYDSSYLGLGNARIRCSW